MAARRSTPETPPLTDGDVDGLRQRLADGEAPRVTVRAASAAVPAGTRGTVVRLGDPAQDEYVVVRIGRDEVPFSPSELSLPSTARSRRAAAAAAKPAAPVKPAAPLKPVSRETPAKRPARKRAPAGKPPAPLTVTLRFTGGDWSAEASRGSRRLARPAPLRPGAVSALAEHVDDEALRAALVETVEACRAVIEERTAALRAELQTAEAALRDYETRPRRSR